MAWAPIRMVEGHISGEWESGLGAVCARLQAFGCWITWRCCLGQLGQLEAQSVGKSLGGNDSLWNIWFSLGIEVFQYINNQCRLINAYWLSALSVEKLIMKILLPRFCKDPVTCAVLHWSTSITPRGAGWGWGQLVKGRDQVPNFCL